MKGIIIEVASEPWHVDPTVSGPIFAFFVTFILFFTFGKAMVIIYLKKKSPTKKNVEISHSRCNMSYKEYRKRDNCFSSWGICLANIVVSFSFMSNCVAIFYLLKQFFVFSDIISDFLYFSTGKFYSVKLKGLSIVFFLLSWLL